jgi:hypothetical protein
MSDIKFFEEHGYKKDREVQLRSLSEGREGSLSLEAANQIKHLKDCLRDLVSITKIHSKATGNNFAWAEIEESEKALNQ